MVVVLLFQVLVGVSGCSSETDPGGAESDHPQERVDGMADPAHPTSLAEVLKTIKRRSGLDVSS